MDPLVVPADILTFSDEELLRISERHDNLRIERDADGNIYIMAPAGGISSNVSGAVVGELFVWNRETKAGKVFDASGGYRLPSTAVRAPDASWIPIEKWNVLTVEERRGFLRLCPDFVVEVRSFTDSLSAQQAKMREWMENGCRLGWLIDPFDEQVHIYRPGEKEPELIASFDETLSGEEVLTGFEIALQALRE